MYEFITHTSNPIKGLCPHKCCYCYMEAIFRRYHGDQTLRLDENELNASYGKGNFVFMGSSTDIFANAVPGEWIVKTYDKCARYNENRYLFQSKNPGRFLDPLLMGHPLMQDKDRIFFATTIESNRDYPISKAQSMLERVNAMTILREQGFRVMVTMEPIMEFDYEIVIDMMRKISPFQVNIGCNSSKDIQLPEPTRDEIIALVRELRTFTNVKLKSNSYRILGDISLI